MKHESVARDQGTRTKSRPTRGRTFDGFLEHLDWLGRGDLSLTDRSRHLRRRVDLLRALDQLVRVVVVPVAVSVAATPAPAAAVRAAEATAAPSITVATPP